MLATAHKVKEKIPEMINRLTNHLERHKEEDEATVIMGRRDDALLMAAGRARCCRPSFDYHLMEYKEMSLHDACNYVVKDKLVKFGGEGGLIAIDANANIELVFNSDGMYRAWKKNNDETQVRIYED